VKVIYYIIKNINSKEVLISTCFIIDVGGVGIFEEFVFKTKFAVFVRAGR